MASDDATGISLWLEPTGPSRARFTSLIKKLAEDLGTPQFNPHLTLLGSLEQPEAEVMERARDLALRQPPIEVRLTRPGVGTQYYHFLFFEVAATRGLLDARAAACRAFDVKEQGFLPHMSLAYALPDEHSPEELLEQFRGRPWGRFRSESLTVIRTAGAPEDWEVLARLPLKG